MTLSRNFGYWRVSLSNDEMQFCLKLLGDAKRSALSPLPQPSAGPASETVVARLDEIGVAHGSPTPRLKTAWSSAFEILTGATFRFDLRLADREGYDDIHLFGSPPLEDDSLATYFYDEDRHHISYPASPLDIYTLGYEHLHGDAAPPGDGFAETFTLPEVVVLLLMAADLATSPARVAPTWKGPELSQFWSSRPETLTRLVAQLWPLSVALPEVSSEFAVRGLLGIRSRSLLHGLDGDAYTPTTELRTILETLGCIEEQVRFRLTQLLNASSISETSVLLFRSRERVWLMETVHEPDQDANVLMRSITSARLRTILAHLVTVADGERPTQSVLHEDQEVESTFTIPHQESLRDDEFAVIAAAAGRTEAGSPLVEQHQLKGKVFSETKEKLIERDILQVGDGLQPAAAWKRPLTTLAQPDLVIEEIGGGLSQLFESQRYLKFDGDSSYTVGYSRTTDGEHRFAFPVPAGALFPISSELTRRIGDVRIAPTSLTMSRHELVALLSVSDALKRNGLEAALARNPDDEVSVTEETVTEAYRQGVDARDMRWLVTLERHLNPVEPLTTEEVAEGFQALVRRGLLVVQPGSSQAAARPSQERGALWSSWAKAEAALRVAIYRTASNSLWAVTVLYGDGVLWLLEVGDSPNEVHVQSVMPIELKLRLELEFEQARSTPSPAVEPSDAATVAADEAPSSCPSCGASLRRGTRFCTQCGSDVHDVQQPTSSDTGNCRSCGKKLQPQHQFCTGCGAPRTS